MDSDFYLIAPGAQLTKAEREFLKNAAAVVDRVFDNPVIVNIGVMWGASMHCLRAGSSKAKLIGVDIDYEKYKVKMSGMLNAKFVTGNSQEGKDVLLPDINMIHLLFIDGAHEYDAVLSDIQGWHRWVAVGGYMIMHDYKPTQHNLDQFPHIAGVKKAMDEFMGRYAQPGDWEELPSPDSIKTYRRV
jgi:cephalosporin hydroxylase